MAQPPVPKNAEAAALIERIERSRGQLGGHLVDLRRTLDVPARVKQSILRKPLAWFGGSLGIGLLASRLLRRPRKSAPRPGWLGLLLTGAVALFKPIVKGVITSELQRRFIRHPEGQSLALETRLPLSKP